MKWIKYILVLVVVLPVLAYGQALQDIAVKRERVFTGAGLYGFMNGGADLYLEYGVSKLVTREVVYKGEEFTVDIYELPTPADAFGIYSLHAFKCRKADSIACFDCLSAYQLSAAVGSNYVSIVFQSGSSAAQQAAYELLRLYADVSNAPQLTVPDLLNAAHPYSGVVKYLRGALSVSNAQPTLSSVVDGIAFTGIWLVTDNATKESRALIYLADAADAEKITSRLNVLDVIESGEKYVYIRCPKKEAEKVISPFGF